MKFKLFKSSLLLKHFLSLLKI